MSTFWHEVVVLTGHFPLEAQQISLSGVVGISTGKGKVRISGYEAAEGIWKARVLC